MKEGRTLKIIKPCLWVPQNMVSVPKMSEVTTTTLSWLSRALNTSRQPLTPCYFKLFLLSSPMTNSCFLQLSLAWSSTTSRK